MAMEPKPNQWVCILPYGKALEAAEYYADATLYDDSRGIAVFVYNRLHPELSELPISPMTLWELRGYLPTLSLIDAFNAETFYGVGVGEGLLPDTLQGCWVDDANRIYWEDALILSDAGSAIGLGTLLNQQCILGVFPPKGTGDGTLYLMVDTPANRGVALSVSGGYTADGEHLLVASTEPLPTGAIEGLIGYRPVRMEFLNL